MAISAQRRLQPTEVRRFGSGLEHHEIPDLTSMQTASYRSFIQEEIPLEKRKDEGLEGVLKEIFPIESYDKQVNLEYLRYDLAKLNIKSFEHSKIAIQAWKQPVRARAVLRYYTGTGFPIL